MTESAESVYERALGGSRHHRCAECGEYCWPLRYERDQLERERDELARGLLAIAELAMPNTYFATDSRCQAARAALGQ